MTLYRAHYERSGFVRHATFAAGSAWDAVYWASFYARGGYLLGVQELRPLTAQLSLIA